MEKKKRKQRLNSTVEHECPDITLDDVSIIVLSIVGLLVFTYWAFAFIAAYNMVVTAWMK